jgi:hypothetical protein
MISDFGFWILDFSIAHPEECEHGAGERKFEIRNSKFEIPTCAVAQ